MNNIHIDYLVDGGAFWLSEMCCSSWMHVRLWDPNGINPIGINELANVIARHLSMIFLVALGI